MLDGLDDLPWSEFQDHYARPATQMPQLIRTLVTDDVENQRHALEDVFDRICHQASVNPLTVVVIPFLVELLSDGRVQIKAEILSCLRTLAIGLDSDHLYRMTRVNDHLEELSGQSGTRAAAALVCYWRVRKAVPDFLRLLDHDQLNVRVEAAYNLSWFPIDAGESLPQLRNRLVDKGCATELANCILSVGLLEYQAMSSDPVSGIVHPFLTDERDAVRYASAIYINWHGANDAARQVLQVLSVSEDAEFSEIPFHDYAFWFQYAENRLAMRQA
ncbi:hypothetical protein [Novipirellula sp.]|uniref:hypothetical protein n=1 Tax=Novipirellula sp. TaxID=2795430 RepID=UPI00356665F1